jgi:hypothetical protein
MAIFFETLCSLYLCLDFLFTVLDSFKRPSNLVKINRFLKCIAFIFLQGFVLSTLDLFWPYIETTEFYKIYTGGFFNVVFYGSILVFYCSCMTFTLFYLVGIYFKSSSLNKNIRKSVIGRQIVIMFTFMANESITGTLLILLLLGIEASDNFK